MHDTKFVILIDAQNTLTLCANKLMATQELISKAADLQLLIDKDPNGAWRGDDAHQDLIDRRDALLERAEKNRKECEERFKLYRKLSKKVRRGRA